jgi:hypothetical protein
MMKNRHSNRRFYEYDPDANSFAGVGFAVGEVDNDNDDGSIVSNLHRYDKPLLDAWTPLACHGFDDNPPEVGDFPSVSNWRVVPMLSERAWQVLQPVLCETCEALPVNTPFESRYFLIHVLSTVDALDEQASEVERRSIDDPRIRNVLRYAFRNELIAGLHIFKLANRQGGGLIVDDVFRNVVESNGLRGLCFRELPMKVDE